MVEEMVLPHDDCHHQVHLYFHGLNNMTVAAYCSLWLLKMGSMAIDNLHLLRGLIAWVAVQHSCELCENDCCALHRPMMSILAGSFVAEQLDCFGLAAQNFDGGDCY